MSIEVKVAKYPDRKNLVLRWTDSVTGKPKTKTSGTTRRREAERAAAKLEANLLSGQSDSCPAITWKDFRNRYETDYLSTLADGTYRSVCTTFTYVEEITAPELLRDLTAANIATWQSRLRMEGLAAATVGLHSRQLKAALNWAHDMGLLTEVPKIKAPKKSKAGKMKGRPVTLEEFGRMLERTAAVVGLEAVSVWQRFLHGLWLSGLRIGEAVRLSWDSEERVSVCVDHQTPCFRFRSGGQKSGRVELVPMAPDFAEMLLAIPEVDRHGRVFGLEYESDWASKVVCRIGEAAGVIVERGTRKGKPHIKYASAHDLRRAFGLRWSKLVMPPVLMQLMRHQDIKTTMAFYVGRDIADAAEQLQAAFDGQKINDSITPPEVMTDEDD